MQNRVIKLLIGVGLLGALFFVVDLNALWLTLKQLTLGWIIAIGFVGVLLILVSALKWQLFVTAAGDHVSLWRLFKLYVVGYFVNLLLPSFVGGDATRSYYVGKSVGQHHAFASTLLERLTGFGAMMVLGILGTLTTDLVSNEVRWTLYGLTALFFLGVFVGLSDTAIRVIRQLPIVYRFAGHCEKIQAATKIGLASPRLLVGAIGYSFLFHMLTVINTIVCGMAVGWTSPPVLELMIVLPIILTLGALPISPAGLGVQEGAFVVFLQQVGATPEQGLAIGLILRAKIYLWALIGWYWFHQEQRQSAHAQS